MDILKLNIQGIEYARLLGRNCLKRGSTAHSLTWSCVLECLHYIAGDTAPWSKLWGNYVVNNIFKSSRNSVCTSLVSAKAKSPCKLRS